MHPYHQPPRRSRTGRVVLLIVAIVLVVACGGVGGVGFLLYKVISGASEEPRAATHAFVGDLAGGNTDAAYGKLCARVRALFDASEFATIVAAQPRPTKATITGFSVTDGSAEIRTTLTLADGSSLSHAFTLVEEGGAWKICGSPY